MTPQEPSILEHARGGRPAEAVDALFRLKPRDLVEATRSAVVHLVTEDKDVAAAILLGWSGATRVQALAGAAPRIHGLDVEFAEHARSLFFTLGSLLWPGWGASELELDATARAIGFACAERARRLALEVDVPMLLRSRSHWLVGVHAMFAGEAGRAREELARAARCAEVADAAAEARLLRAYLLMAQAAAEAEDVEIPYELARACRALELEDQIAPFGQQLRVAWMALAPDRPLPDPVHAVPRDREPTADA